MSDCFLCVSPQSIRMSGKSSFQAAATSSSSIKAVLLTKGKLTPQYQQFNSIKCLVSAVSKLNQKINIKHNPSLINNQKNSNIKGWLKVSGNARASLISPTHFTNKYVDKFAGEFKLLSNISNFAGVQKLYPISDSVTSLNNSYFVDKNLNSGNLYQSIDEGLFVGNYNENFNTSYRITDDNISYIQPSSIFTNGAFRYRCEVTRPLHHPKNSFLFIRASAPLSNYGSDIPPEYRIHNIRLEDPSGNTIIKYKDISLRGDADYSLSKINYSTYISEPEINNANLHSWDENYPILSEPSGYKLNLDFDVFCLDDPFDAKFNEGYEEKSCDLKTIDQSKNNYLAIEGSPLSTQTQGYGLNPTNTLRISSIEICNSGDLCSYCDINGIKYESKLGFYTNVNPIGERLSRTIYPLKILDSSYDVGIYPTAFSIWESSEYYDINGNIITALNTTASGSQVLTSFIKEISDDSYITLKQTDPVNDSGRLTLHFSHKPPQPYTSKIGGAFDISTNNSFDTAKYSLLQEDDNFFTVDTIELKVIAKKNIGSPDYVLDVVGYSDDKILNVTPKIGAFLQNKHEVYYITDEHDNTLSTQNQEFLVTQNQSLGNVPLTSGLKNINELGISSQSLSDKDQYYEDYVTSIDAGDHYKLSTLPVINSTQFKEYTIPLQIYEDYVTIGKSKDYSISSYFENLYLDLYPIPSGASIASVRLVVTYKPSNGMVLHTFGTPIAKQLDRKDIKLLPTGVTKNNDTSLNNQFVEISYLGNETDDFIVSENNDFIIVNSGFILSKINNIPHSYKEPETLKTNYSRRWRGVDGNIVSGPYNINQFDFSFYNPESDHPFLNGYFDFNHTSGRYILSTDYLNSGYYNGSDSILKNIGLRFNNSQLFNIATSYTTIDWTQNNDSIYGKIIDAYDSAIRVSGQYGNINFGNKPLNSGFAFYIRFTPDQSIIGSGYNLFNSGVIASKWDDEHNLDFTLGFKNGYLSLLARDIHNNILELNDTTPYNNYQYPLSIVSTYIPGSPSGQLRLYCNNELSNDLYLKNTKQIILDSGNNNFVVGYSYGSGVGINAFIHEVGFSTSGNLVHSSPNRFLKQTTVDSFLDGHSHSLLHNITNNKFKLHKYINDDTSLWKLGDFKICSFSPDFDGFTTRVGQDYIIHTLKHHGSGYSQTTNIPIPSSIYASGLSYHSQIENDFIRFNLQDMPDANPEFYTTSPRICKTLPRDYSFAERAMVVDTIIEHNTDNNIIWPDGSIGPKLIVSLYSKNQEPVDRPSKKNWGLINRSIHYIPPSGCYEKISSTFNYNDLIDISEPWALFDLDNIRSEFDHKYYSTDINDMFLQYDLVYPSGSPFQSTIKIHSANVRLENALAYWADNNNNLNLYSSGESISYNNLNLNIFGLDTIYVSNLNLHTTGSSWPVTQTYINLYTYGSLGVPNSSFNLFVKNSGIISELGPDLYISGGYPRDEQSLPLVMIDNTNDQIRYNSLPLIVKNIGTEIYNDILPLITSNGFSNIEWMKYSDVNLVVFNDEFLVYNLNNNLNLYTNTDLGYTSLDQTFNLFTINYLAFNQQINQQSSISWNINNIGYDIDPIIDSDVPYLEANDEIRGVDLLCYGDCNNVNSCKEKPISLHDIDWYQSGSCFDGGILRVKNTYTNLDVSGFKSEIGYSGHFYGIRKYTGLIPNAPYDITIKTQTGKNDSIKLPTQFVEIDYGSNQYVNYSGVKFAADKDLDNSERQEGNKFGKSVAVAKDLIAIGAPMQTLPYNEYDASGNLVSSYLENAGSVFLYRRGTRPSGFNWPEGSDKSSWHLETKLTLPSGILKDYPTKVISDINGIPITKTFWNAGQNGREFGHSLDLAINDNIKSFEEPNRQILVVGGPSAKWQRDFEEFPVSGVSIGIIVFTDEFVPSWKELVSTDPLIIKDINYTLVQNNIKDKDTVFTYFSNPPVKFDVKLMICEPISSNSNTTELDFAEPKPSFIVKKRIPRNSGKVDEEDRLAVFSGIKSAFDEAFPYDSGKLNNNIPVILGVYVDNSCSLGRKAISPGLDSFLSYYKEYSFASGLMDFYGVKASGAIYEHNTSSLRTEDWINSSIILLNNLLDTGRLVRDNQVRFFSSGIGAEFFNTSLSEFNYPPSSGGRVYVFEKESGNWNLIQEIKSPVVSYTQHDRYGHSVAISKNTEVITVGSPYINECCQVFQYNHNEKTRLYNGLYSWLNYKNSLLGGDSQRYNELIENYSQWASDYGITYSNSILYSKLTSTEKFEARQYLNITEYEKIFTYSYGDIPYIGNGWKLIPERFAPTSRLGYSTAVNEDGSLVAFGAPTDSFNIFDDQNIYYQNGGYNDPFAIDNINGSIKPGWSSSVNAGAVRLFESRKYYPHKKVVEFGKFGNLQQSLNDPLDSGHFNYISSIFSDKTFVKTTSSTNSIPQDAGLAFIITPGEDALSEEVTNNIIEWLSLGDRNLVLVGNDPIWESSGVYSKSNFIINKLLSLLNSKMRLHPARNIYESLPSGSSTVIPSFRPQNGISTYIQPYNLNTAYGVADIRIHFPEFKSLFMGCSYVDEDTNEKYSLNDKCELPLVHNGDLRSQWYEQCINSKCEGNILYPVNWPFIFKTFSPPCCSNNPLDLEGYRYDLAGQEPIPIMVASEKLITTLKLPRVPAIYKDINIIENETINTPITVFEFDEGSISGNPSFIWDSGNTQYSSYSGNINQSLGSLWYTPPAFNNTQGVIQAQGYSNSKNSLTTSLIYPISPYSVQQIFDKYKIIAIAGVKTESQNSLYANGSDDKNIHFYVSMVSKNSNGNASIAQLGGWTGRTSFVDAYPESILEEIFINTGNDVTLNVTNLSPLYDICWIANPKNLPSENDIIDIKNWLNLGDKKLIITHDSTVSQMLLVSQILELLDTDIKPVFLPQKNTYFKTINNGILSLNVEYLNSISFSQCGYDSTNTSVSEYFYSVIEYYPFISSETVIPISYADIAIYDDKFIVNDYFTIFPGIDKISFPVMQGSGYKLFINYVSDSNYETYPIDIYIDNCNIKPSESSQLSASIPNIDNSKNITESSFDFQYNAYLQLNGTNRGEVTTQSVNIQASSGTLNLYLHSLATRITTTDYIPKTPKILSISGVLLPIIASVKSKGYTIPKIVGVEKVLVSEEIPESTISEYVFRPISTLNDKYCVGQDCFELGLNNKFIADGPVVVAQEVENISSFNTGVNRSRITVISDSNLVQGRFMVDEFGRMSAETVSFIRSLYPETTFPSNNFGRQYGISTKIISPERGSPQKYHSLLASQSGIISRFDNYGNSAIRQSFDDNESRYDPKYVVREDPPWEFEGDPKKKEKLINDAVSDFVDQIRDFGGWPKYSGVIDGTIYEDAGIGGGLPKLMIDKGYDYLDFDNLPSGYPGDLFGFSIALHGNKLIVGSPFSAFSDDTIHPWAYYNYINLGGSGVKLSHNGGAGSVYVYEKTFNGSGVRNTKTPWEFIQKIRPNNINIGQDITQSGNNQYSLLGPNSYSSTYLNINTFVGDQFGYSVDTDGDIIAVGAPGHDFDKIVYDMYNSGSFIRKCFNDEFDIPKHFVIDTGASGVRDSINSGLCVLNNGAIFTFENKIVDWSTREQKWTFIEKIIPQGYNRIQNNNENDNFGRCVSIDRVYRSDADYIIVGGCENQDYSSSGDSFIQSAGAAYTNDIILRESSPALPSPSSYIDVKVFGELVDNYPIVRAITLNDKSDQSYYTSGLIYSNKDGAIFLEASGQDLSSKRFLQHIPYVVSIDGLYKYGLPDSGILPLFVDGYVDYRENIDLFVVGSTGNVYNNLGLYSSSIVDFGSGNLNFYTDCPSPTHIFESGLPLFTASGIGINTDSLNIRIRGY